MQNRFNPKPVKIASTIRIEPNNGIKTPDQIRDEMHNLKKNQTSISMANSTQVVKNKIENMNRLKRGL